MTTVRDVVNDSLGEIGVLSGGEAATYEDASLAFRVLNRMVDQWAAEDLLIWHLLRHVFDIVAERGEYRLGTAAETYSAITTDGFDTTWTGEPPGWTVEADGSVSIENETTVTVSGGHAVKLEATGAGSISITRNFTVLSGTEGTLSMYLRGDGGATGALVQVRCVETGLYLQTNGEWLAVPNEVFTQTAAAYAQFSQTFTVEDEAVVGGDTATLEVTFSTNGSSGPSAAYCDSLVLSNIPPSAILPTIEIPWLTKLEKVHLLDNSTTPARETPLAQLTETGWANVVEKDAEDEKPEQWYYSPDLTDHDDPLPSFFGTLYLYPIPTGSDLQGVIYAKVQIAKFESLDTTVFLPPGYEEFLVSNLALRLCPAYSRTPHPALIERARQSKTIVKRANILKPTDDLVCEAAALIGSRSTYSIRSG